LGERGKSAAAKVGGGLLTLVIATGLAACGGGQRQDATEPNGKFPVKVTQASFPTHQRISERNDLVLGVENAGKKALPDLAITIYTGETKAQEPFDVLLDQSNLANPSRPVWILENGYPKVLGKGVTVANANHAPTGGATAAQTDTFQFGRLKPGQSRRMLWRVTPAKAGTYTVHYEVAAGLQGNAKAVTPGGAPVKGEFVVTISSKPPQTCVTGSGKVVSGSCQLSGGISTGGGSSGGGGGK
jgi:uncharacterized membrane protein YgcG